MSQYSRPTATRRRFIQATAFSASAVALRGERALGANDTVRAGLIGCGGRGTSLAGQFAGLKNVDVVAISDPDTAQMDKLKSKVLDKKQSGVAVARHQDYRKLLEDKSLDVVIIATPNHWHTLVAIHAMQAGKDVYVEKPVCHDIWEGRQLVAAVEKYGRIVQAGTQNRSDVGLIKAFAHIQSGEIGAIKAVRGLCYRNRSSIGKSETPIKAPPTCDYDLWLGPARDLPMFRRKFHYDWHWIYNTGNGDVGNQAPHEFDLVSWVLGDPALPEKVQSFGNRFGWNDGGETANIQTVWYELGGVPVIFEVNDLWRKPDLNAGVTYKSLRVGVIVTCEGGEFRGGRGGGYILAPDGKTKIAKFPGDSGGGHAQNFIDAVRSRRADDLRAPIAKSFRSAAVPHLANISLRTGTAASTADLRQQLHHNADLADVITRQEAQLNDWNIDTTKEPYLFGPAVTVDPASERILGPESAQALYKENYRSEFAIPEIA
jgi:predicted dehydrogenase